MPIRRTNHTSAEHPTPEPRRRGRQLWHFLRRKISWRRLFFMGVLAGIILLAAATVYAAWISRDLPDPNNLASRQVAQSTKIYDRTGQHLLYEIFSDKKRTIVELKDIPQHAINATIAVEDAKFFEHHGIRFTAILRAMIANTLHLSSGRGGASTLTQQLVKNAIVGDEHSLNRKIKEAILALQLERKYSKQEILKLYFNEIPYGSTNYGIESAAQSYFGKSARDLTLSEAAALAGMVQAPTYYLNRPDKLKDRRNLVLNRMRDVGFITSEQAESTKQETLTLRERLTGIDAPHYVMYVKELLTKQFGEKAVETGGLKVITALDYDLYKIAEEEIKKYLDSNSEKYNIGNAALTAIDPANGHVVVMVGSRDFFDEKHDGQVNVAVRPRQPGSSFKPFVYSAGFEKGYTPDTLLYDVITNFDNRPGQSYIPKNFNGKEYGPVTVRMALQGSLNIPAVEMLYLVGIDYMVDYAKRFGYTTLSDKSRLGLSMVLGGGEVTLLEHTDAYATLANNGTYHAPAFVLAVTDASGNELFQWKEERRKAVEPDIAATISGVLADDEARAYIFGRNSNLTLPSRPVAAKTGTTNDYRDGWTMGYTPQLAAGVWTGNNDNSPMKQAGGSIAASPIWRAFMVRALKDKPVLSFPKPPENTATKPVLRGSNGGKVTVRVDKLSGKLATEHTPAEFVEERTYMQPHSILHYVDKDDPRGPEPSNPGNDPQYILWETGVKDWINKQQQTSSSTITFGFPPTEKDDMHVPELQPTITFISPEPNTTFTSWAVSASIHVNAPRGISEVKYYVDDTLVSITNAFPFSFSHETRSLARGNHTLRARAYDDVGNMGETSIQFTFDPSTPSTGE